MKKTETLNSCKGRVLELDLIRVLACLMVIMMHSPMPVESQDPSLQSLVAVGISYLCSPCIGLFFMVSGALLLPKALNVKHFLRKRLHKVLFPTLLATLFYLIISHVESETSKDLIRELLSIPFSAQGTGILWFMYTLIGLYLLAPIIGTWLASLSDMKGARFYIVLWIVTLCYPIVSLFADVNESPTGILYYFGGYAGYFLLGYIMHHCPKSVRWRWLAVPILLSIASPLVCRLMNWKVGFYSMFWYLSIFVAVMCMAWFKAILQWGKLLYKNTLFRKGIVLFSNLSFGIYLTHIFFMRSVLWKSDFIQEIQSYSIQTMVIFSLTTLISFSACMLISLLPGSEYIMGWHYRMDNN